MSKDLVIRDKKKKTGMVPGAFRAATATLAVRAVPSHVPQIVIKRTAEEAIHPLVSTTTEDKVHTTGRRSQDKASLLASKARMDTQTADIISTTNRPHLYV